MGRDVSKGGFTVAQKPSGLRFDIYERVHLPEGAIGIHELDEVELIPEIQVTPDGEQALLQGHLTLNSTYGSTSNAEIGEARTTETLVYQIPVEITLPMSRVKNIENISVEIENFDVDLISARSLNVTGVLTLNGIETNAAAVEDLDGEDEVVFVHEASETRVNDRIEISNEEALLENSVVIASEEEAVREETQSAPTSEEIRPDPQGEVLEPAPVPAAALDTESAFEAAEPVMAELDDEIEISDEDLIEAMAEVDDEVVDVQATKKEPKIAFGSKVSNDNKGSWTTWFREGDSNEQLTASASTIATSVASAETPAIQADAVKASSDEASGWKSFLLSNRNEQQFKKVRLCIVQKDETIDTIAERYALKAREIQLYNKLSEPALTKGQIIYVPTI
jgi:stage VI sporulation protein D